MLYRLITCYSVYFKIINIIYKLLFLDFIITTLQCVCVRISLVYSQNLQVTFCCLNQAGNGAARQTSVASEALALTSGVVALNKATTLVGIEVSRGELGDGLGLEL